MGRNWKGETDCEVEYLGLKLRILCIWGLGPRIRVETRVNTESCVYDEIVNPRVELRVEKSIRTYLDPARARNAS